MTLTAKTSLNADKDPFFDGYLSAFGISIADPYDMPAAFKPAFADAWDSWTLKYEGGVVTADRTFMLLRALAFADHLSRKGHNNYYAKPPKLKGLIGARLTTKQVYDKLVLNALSVVALEVSTLLRKTDLLGSFKITRTKSACTATQVITMICLERLRKTDRMETVLGRLRDILKNNGVLPVQLREVVQPAVGPKGKPKVTTPKVESLMTQFGTSFGWLPVVRTSAYEVYLVRGRDSKLVLKMCAPLNPRLLKAVPKATVVGLWAKAFRTMK